MLTVFVGYAVATMGAAYFGACAAFGPRHWWRFNAFGACAFAALMAGAAFVVLGMVWPLYASIAAAALAVVAMGQHMPRPPKGRARHKKVWR